MNQMVQTKHSIDVEARSAAPPEKVWPLLATTSAWTSWSSFDSAELSRHGTYEAEGVGAERRFRKGRTRSHEQVVAFDAPRHFAYILLEGLPVKGYRADVTLVPDGDGTRIQWHSSFDAKLAGTGWLYRMALRRFIQQTADGLARGAERAN